MSRVTIQASDRSGNGIEPGRSSARTPCEPWDGLNGARVELSGKTFFIALPRHLWRPLGRCSCPYCTEDNKRPGMGFWDTLAVSAESGHAWTVHRPESHGAKPKRAYRRHGACGPLG